MERNRVERYMMEAFYDKAFSLLFGFSVLLVSLVVTVELSILYIFSQDVTYYFSFAFCLLISFFYGMKYYNSYRDFKSHLHLLLPQPESEKPLSPLEAEFDEKSLQVCLSYRNGFTLNQIKENMGFSHATQVTREMKKGLAILLKFYKEHKQEVKK